MAPLLDWLGRFQDETLQNEFIIYCMEQRSKFSFGAMTAIVLSLLIIEGIASTWFNENANSNESTSNLIYGILSLIMSALGLIFCAILCFSLEKWTNKISYSYIQVLLIVSINIVFLIQTIKCLHLGDTQCVPKQFKPLLSTDPNVTPLIPDDCPPNDSYLSIVNFNAILTIHFSYQILTAIIFEPRLYVLWLCHFPTSFLMFFSIYKSFYGLVPLLICFVTLTFLQGELHFQRTQSFLNQRKLQQLLEENERNADANHAMEMRHMIGNVAHDLKTVSTTK